MRSDAIWLAEHWTTVRDSYTGNGHNPQFIRQECRAAGFEWAGETEHQRKRKENSKRALLAAANGAGTSAHQLKQAI